MRFAIKFVAWFRQFILPFAWIFPVVALPYWTYVEVLFILRQIGVMPYMWGICLAFALAIFSLSSSITFIRLVLYNGISPYDRNAQYEQSLFGYFLQVVFSLAVVLLCWLFLPILGLGHWHRVDNGLFALAIGGFFYLLMDSFFIIEVQDIKTEDEFLRPIVKQVKVRGGWDGTLRVAFEDYKKRFWKPTGSPRTKREPHYKK